MRRNLLSVAALLAGRRRARRTGPFGRTIPLRRQDHAGLARLQEAGVSGARVERPGRLAEEAAAKGEDSQGGGDIITVDTFDNFDLQFEWKVAPGGNSGVKYLVTEDRSGPIAHEYQVIDDVRHADAKIGPNRTTAPSTMRLPRPPTSRCKPAGEINAGRIVVNGRHVEHWLNGVKVSSTSWAARR